MIHHESCYKEFENDVLDRTTLTAPHGIQLDASARHPALTTTTPNGIQTRPQPRTAFIPYDHNPTRYPYTMTKTPHGIQPRRSQLRAVSKHDQNHERHPAPPATHDSRFRRCRRGSRHSRRSVARKARSFGHRTGTGWDRRTWLWGHGEERWAGRGGEQCGPKYRTEILCPDHFVQINLLEIWKHLADAHRYSIGLNIGGERGVM